MRFRLRAFGLHLLSSVCVLTLILGVLYLGWYGWPGWYLTGVMHIVLTLVAVDVVLGPTLTLIVANPGKPRRVLARDIGIIVLVQVAALVYGSSALWAGRPLYYTFSSGVLDVVQASAVAPGEAERAARENPAFAPHWYSVPRWVWAPLPEDPDEAAKIMTGAVFGGGSDVISMPRYFKGWSQGRVRMRDALSRVADLSKLSKQQKQAVAERMAKRGLPVDQANALILWATDGVKRLVVILDRDTLQTRAILRTD
jgi:hypothetical protein